MKYSYIQSLAWFWIVIKQYSEEVEDGSESIFFRQSIDVGDELFDALDRNLFLKFLNILGGDG